MYPLFKNYFDLVKRIIPSPSQGKAVGLDIGAGDCKLVELSKGPEGFAISHFSIEAIKNGNISSTIKDMIASLETPCKSVYTSVFGKGTLIRYIDMPRMSLEDLRNSFAIEADKYFPFAQNQIYTDCFILDPSGKDKRMAVLAAAVKKEMVDQRIALFTELGIPVDFIGINSIALANAAHVLGLGAELGKGSVFALLDMGDSVSSLTIFIDSLPWFMRDIFIGGRDITNRVCNVFGVGFEEAEKLKRDPGKRLEEVLNASETAIMNIVREMRLSFDYFTTERNVEIKNLYLTGGASMMQGMSEVFEKNLDVKVRTWDPLASRHTAAGVSSEQIRKISLRMGVAVGLALYNYD